MWHQDRVARRTYPNPRPHAGNPAESEADVSRDGVVPIREAVRSWALEAIVAAYAGDTYRLLSDLADLVEASVAYVDRPTVEAHLERPLSDADWSAVAAAFSAMAFDEHVGDAGTVRTDWIEDTLHRAGVPGRTPAPTVQPGPRPRPMRR